MRNLKFKTTIRKKTAFFLPADNFAVNSISLEREYTCAPNLLINFKIKQESNTFRSVENLLSQSARTFLALKK